MKNLNKTQLEQLPAEHFLLEVAKLKQDGILMPSEVRNLNEIACNNINEAKINLIGILNRKSIFLLFSYLEHLRFEKIITGDQLDFVRKISRSNITAAWKKVDEITGIREAQEKTENETTRGKILNLLGTKKDKNKEVYKNQDLDNFVRLGI